MFLVNNHLFTDINSMQYLWLDLFILSGFLLSYGFLLMGVFFIFWRWSSLMSYQSIVTQFRQGKSSLWCRLVIFSFLCFSGLPPVFFFFNKLAALIYILQNSTVFKGLIILLFLIFSWYAYFILIRWLTLNQITIGYSKQLVFSLFSSNATYIWVLVFFFLISLVLFMDDFFIYISWLFL